MKQFLLLSAFMSTLFISACGSSSSSFPGGDNRVSAQGVVYPIVIGLSYETNSGSGEVASDGSYTYKENENVTFSAGGIELVTVPATARVTPLPLDDDIASTNLLRLLKALDTDGDLSNGVSLSPLATSNLTNVDLTSEVSVAAVLTSLAPAATLPAANDEQIITVLADTKTTALQNMGTYGSTYEAIEVTQLNGSSLPGYPKDAVVTLTSQPNWTTGSITGTAVIKLNDNSVVTLPINNTKGTYTASGSTFDYGFSVSYGAKTRIFFLYIGLATTPSTAKSVRIVLRDNSQPNMPPVPGLAPITVTPNFPNGPAVYDYTSIPAGPGGVIHGSKDFDGIVVSQTWASSKGKTGTGDYFSESFYSNEKGSITLTVTDDEGATASKTWQINSNATTDATPIVDSISPTTGAPGTSVIITGTNFSITPANNTVKFNGIQATVTTATATSLTVTVPNGVTTGPVSVTTLGGTATSVSSFTVTTTVLSGSLTLSTPINGVSSFNLDWPTFSENSLLAYSSLTWESYDSITGSVNISAIENKQFSPDIALDVTIYYDYFVSWGLWRVTCIPAYSAGSIGGYPTCASVGVTFNKTAGTLTFLDTPTSETGINENFTGTLRFTPY